MVKREVTSLYGSLVKGTWAQMLRLVFIRSLAVLGFPGGSDGKESTCNVRDPGLIPGLGRSPGERTATHSSLLVWRSPWTEELSATVHGVTKSQTGLSD